MDALSVSISNELSVSEQKELLVLFEGDFDRFGEGQRLSPEWVTWILVAKDAGVVFTAINGTVAFAKNLMAFRDKLIKKGTSPGIQITSEGDLMNFAEASDEEIMEWMIRRSRSDRAE